MIRIQLAVLSVLAILVGCGLEDYEYLPPPVLPKYLDQSEFGKLSFAHDPAVFSGTNFLGYEIYYRIFPWSNGAWDNLVRDTDALRNSGLAALDSLGYRRLTTGQYGSGSPLLEMIEESGPQTVTVDFSTFLREQYSLGVLSTPPSLVVVAGATRMENTLYRNSSLFDPQYTTFNTLLENTPGVPSAPDLSKSVTEATADYEVVFFVLSYSFSNLLVASVSTPVPWGIIGPIKEVR